MKQILKRLIKAYRRTVPAMVVFFVVVGLLIAAQVYAHTGPDASRPQRLVTLYDRGVEHVILTHADTVGEALEDADITTFQEDNVEPSLASHITAKDFVINIYRARPIVITDGAVRVKVTTTALTVDDIIASADLAALKEGDQASFTVSKNIVADGAGTILKIERVHKELSGQPKSLGTGPGPNALSKSKGAQMFTDSTGISHRETYYDLNMNIVIGACGDGGYTIRYDGAKIDKDGYVLVAANLFHYPRCSVVETSMGLGKVYDTGGFAVRHPYGFDLATDWTNYNGQ